MSKLKRLSATLFTRIDHMVSQVENHDAVIESAVRDIRQAAARARVRLARVQRDGDKLRERLSELKTGESAWTRRARSKADEEEETAIECLRRRRECQLQARDVAKTLENHRQLEERLTRDIRTAEERLCRMSQQRNLMRTRQSAAEALNAITDVDTCTTPDVEDAFERWEVQVTEAELMTGSADPEDPLERTYIDSEESESLHDELQTLLESKEVDNEH